MSCIDVPLSAPMYQFLERGSLTLAYQTACLGVTESDWETLGKAALETLDLDVARKSFARLKDLRYLELITDLMDRKKAGTEDDQALLADVLAFQVCNRSSNKSSDTRIMGTVGQSQWDDIKIWRTVSVSVCQYVCPCVHSGTISKS